MQTMRICEKTGKDGTVLLRLPFGQPNAEHEIVVTAELKNSPETPAVANGRDWPPGYFDLAGSIDDDSFVRPPQGQIPKPLELE